MERPQEMPGRWAPHGARAWFAAALLGSLATGACSAGDEGPGLPSDASGGTFGLVTLERRVPVVGTVAMTAAFARLRGIEAGPVRELLTGRPELSPGDCTLMDGPMFEGMPAGAGVELLSAGPITVASPGGLPSAATAAPRVFPELGGPLGGPQVSGWVYGEELPEMPHRGAGLGVRVSSDGGEDVGPFELAVEWPPGPGLEDVVPAVDRERGWTASWHAPGAAARAGRVEVQIASAGAAILCAGPDDGQLDVPGEVLRWLPPSATGRLTVRRVWSTPFDAAGVVGAAIEVATVEERPVPIR